jgi:hypothetical protein
VAAQAALQVLLLLDGLTTPPAVGGTLETSVLDGRTRRRSWQPHPGCGCRWPRGALGRGVPKPDNG